MDIHADGKLSLKAATVGLSTTIEAAAMPALTITASRHDPAIFSPDFNATVTIDPGRPLTPEEAGLNLLDHVSILGAANGATFVVPGNVGAFNCGSFVNSSLLVGFVPTDPANPIAGGSFTGDFQLKSFTSTALYIGGNLIAPRIGAVKLCTLQTVIGKPFGIAVDQTLTDNLGPVTTKDHSFSYDPKHDTLPKVLNDFSVKKI